MKEIWAIITANFGQMGANAFKIGDKVRFLNDVGEGRVTGVQPDGQILVEDDDGFEYAHAPSDLIPMESRAEMEQAYERVVPSVLEILQQEMDPARQRKMEQDFKSKYKEAQARPSGGAVEEVDLHLHAIVDSQAGLSPGVMLELQIAHFERMLQIGIRQRTKKMIFIHGIGQGCCATKFGPVWSSIIQTVRAVQPTRDSMAMALRKYGLARRRSGIEPGLFFVRVGLFFCGPFLRYGGGPFWIFDGELAGIHL